MAMMPPAKTFARWGGMIAFAGLLAACGGNGDGSTEGSTGASASGDGPTRLTFVAYGGAGQKAMKEAWQDPYTKLHPEVTFVNTSPSDVAQVKAQVLAGVIQWDVVSVAPYAAEQNCGTLFEKLDLSGLDRQDFPEGAIGDCYVDNFINSPVVAYDGKKWPDAATAPKTVADFFDTKKFPGKRGIVATLQDGMLEYPMFAEGKDPKSLYPIDIDKALAKWEPIREDTIFAPNVGALQQAVSSGQVSMWILVTSRQLALLDSGVDVRPVWDKTLAAANAFAVPKGSKNLAAAEKFLEYVVQPEPSAREAELGGVTAINLKSKPKLSENGKLVDPYGDANTGETVLQDAGWYAQNYNKLQPILTKWLSG
jgi:putative spermidine/putrescine transport system substrate-binding protein